MSNESDTPLLFADLGLSAPVMASVTEVGYETPSPIQAATIPALLAGKDVLGQAQTGTGKTAAFALPILSRLKLDQKKPQALVLAPTRELAIQVAEAFQRYANKIPGFVVLPIYGGQGYAPQLTALKRGVHVVVGTPGRVIDHLDRGTLDLSELTTLVLDEADEMLRMGFIDDVEAVLKKTPPQRQVALFSATMPAVIRRIAQTYLRDPQEVTITSKTTTATNIRQRYWFVSGMHKLDALTRILEAEPYEAMIVFARTKLGTEELAQKLQARGLAAAAINGDIQQQQRERTIQQLKDGKLDILVATDVAARGLDVERISHVLNYDIPYDTESYVHRIGRTGRAGRSGDAILFVTPREKGMLRSIERATRQPIDEMKLPSVEAVNDKRVERFLGRITDSLATGEPGEYRSLVERYEQENNVPMVDIAAALARLLQGDTPLLLGPDRTPAAPQAYERNERHERSERPARPQRSERSSHGDRPAYAERPAPAARPVREERSAPRREESATPFERPAPRSFDKPARETSRIERPSFDAPASERPRFDKAPREKPDVGMESFRIEVGHAHGVKPANIVGAIANEAGLDSKYIGRIDIQDDYTVLDLPEGMPKELLMHLKKVWVSGQQLRIHKVGEGDAGGDAAPRKFKPAAARTGKPSGFKPGPPGKLHRKGPPKPRA
ncbi:DEAD/DEAH box helicase [Pseudoxanthomonas sacheonensis]|uniref:ATP-dependent RNA helicase DeaD n=1 Tax=Pseudoxanthomonas sacheonensis TaxID=443615 RepID=A0ABU1RWK0_9GAMM|nr:DEAD/DEAH box helicase [Pseudoxanthomonas sacheonensis]MDR6842494.1 ATP-dependent RNA helicase DeaD [Pseudoxanthomonas sacheonensis]